MAIQWKAGLLGAASGIALAHVLTKVCVPLLLMAMERASNPVTAILNTTHPTIYADLNLGLGFLSAGIGGFIGASLGTSNPIAHGSLSGGIQAAVYLAMFVANLGFIPSFNVLGLGVYVVAIATIASGAAGGYISSRSPKTLATDSQNEKSSNR